MHNALMVRFVPLQLLVDIIRMCMLLPDKQCFVSIFRQVVEFVVHHVSMRVTVPPKSSAQMNVPLDILAARLQAIDSRRIVIR
jgi:hypothetical protein